VNVDGDGDGDGDGETSQRQSQLDRLRFMLSFQKLDVYRCSIDFLAFTATLQHGAPRGFASLFDQLRRAALSVPLNIAEAAGRGSPPDAARHYAIARGSAMECAAIMDSLRVLSVIDDSRHRGALELIGRIVAMLTKLCR